MADFFDRVDDIGIVEENLQRVLKLEESQTTLLLKRYREIRGVLRDRLDRVMDNTFTAQQLRGVLVQVESAIDAMNSSLKSGMVDQAKILSERGIQDQIEEIRQFSKEFTGAVVPININAQLVAQDTNNFLINRYEASIDAYSEDVRSNLVQVLANESLMETPYSTVIRKMNVFFQGEEWKLHRIARTELHNIYGLGKVNGMLEVRDTVLPGLMKTLIHPMDDRTADDSKYVSRLKLVVPLDKPFRYKWKGKERVFFNSPDRPNDRSATVPYMKEWDT
jgi:hypothetical protein